MEQTYLFGGHKNIKVANEKPKDKQKSFFPDLSLIKGLHAREASAESVFWHRVLLNKAIRAQKMDLFLHLLYNEVHIKNGRKDTYKAIQDSLMHSGELK